MTGAAGFAGLLDDAAVFPPGELPLAEAVVAHGRHREAAYSELVGPFVARGDDLAAVVAAAEAGGVDELPLLVTTPIDRVASVLDVLAAAPRLRAAGLEVTLPEDVDPAALPALLRAAGEVPVAVEVPRDARRPAVIAAIADAGVTAKLRTGGVRAELYPDEQELAEAIAALVARGVAFKATAGLHHALRNTDLETGFEQHGFLNVLAATAAALRGASVEELRDLLAERDAATVVAAVRDLDPRARGLFRSFGTCSIDEPVAELVELGLLPPEWGDAA